VRGLAIENSMEHTDLIFALAGEQHRKECAVKLWSEGFAPRLLLSVARFDIRRFSQLELPVQVDLLGMAAKLSASERHFFVFVEKEQVSVRTIPQIRFGTLREILALRTWLIDHPDIGFLLVVSSAFHLRRVRMCCHSLLPKHLRIAFLGTRSGMKWWKNARLRSHVLTELVKVPFYSLILPLAKLGMAQDRSNPKKVNFPR